MSLQRLTSQPLRLLVPAAMLFIVGCASSGPQPQRRAPVTPPVTEQSAADAASVTAAAELAPMEIPAQARTMFEQAVSIMASGDFLDAELRFKEFLLRYPDYPGAHVNLAIIHSQNGNGSAAQASIDAALSLDAAHPAALNQLGMLLRRNGKFIEAEAAYLKAVTAAPEYALAHYNLGILNELYLQRLDVALQHFETYQQLVGGDEQVEKWIADLTRRVAASQRTANTAE